MVFYGVLPSIVKVPGSTPWRQKPIKDYKLSRKKYGGLRKTTKDYELLRKKHDGLKALCWLSIFDWMRRLAFSDLNDSVDPPSSCLTCRHIRSLKEKTPGAYAFSCRNVWVSWKQIPAQVQLSPFLSSIVLVEKSMLWSLQVIPETRGVETSPSIYWKKQRELLAKYHNLALPPPLC